MNHLCSSAQIEELLSVERELEPQPEDVCRRVLRRARASVPRILYAHRAAAVPGRPRRWVVGQIAAAAVVLSSLCSAAFYAGYRLKSHHGGPVPAATPAATPGTTEGSNPGGVSESVDPGVSVAPLWKPAASAAAPNRAPRAALPAKGKRTVPARTASDAYAAELRVLQLAQRAVAGRDYPTALAAIAEHRRQFPAGRLAEEREALRVKALLGLGRSAEAQYAGMVFRERFPQSALRGRVDDMLEAQK